MKQPHNKSLQRTNFTVTTKKNEEEFLWHSPTASFTDFDDSKIGKVSNKYGWGIYFSTEKNNARSHNNSIDHIYKFPKSKLDGKSFIYYSKSIKKHDDPHVISVAKAFYNDRFDDEEFDVGGHRFYEDIVEGMNNKGEASRFLVQQGISGGLIKEPSEVSVLLYDTSLWDHAVKVPL
jgi:hypothetical protein